MTGETNPLGLQHQHGTGHFIEHALGRIANQETRHARAADRAHHQKARRLRRCEVDDRVGSAAIGVLNHPALPTPVEIRDVTAYVAEQLAKK